VWWLLFVAGVVVVLSVFAWWPNLRRLRRGGGAPHGPSEGVLREGDRASGMMTGWRNMGGPFWGGGGGDGGGGYS
jgi:hypothetical protein